MPRKQENGISVIAHKDSNGDNTSQPKKDNLSFRQRISSWRWMTALIIWFGFVNATLMGNSFNMALVCMTGSAPPPRKGDNLTTGQGNSSTDLSLGEFDWDATTQGVIFSSAMYVGFVAPAASGFLAKRFGGKRVIGTCITLRALMYLLTPLGARTHLYVLIAMRVICGCVSNSLQPSTQSIWSHWAPDQEKVQLVSTSLSGVNIGSLVASLISGFLCTIPIDNGWPFIFYVFGGTTLLWCVIWWIFVYDTPDQHPWISEEERKYISDNIKTKPDKSISVPYMAIFTSAPMWAFFVIQTVHRLCIVVFFTYLPKYMRDVLRFPIEQNAIVSSVPYASRFVGVIFWGLLADQMAKRNVSTTANRKIVQSAGFLSCAALTAGIGFMTEDERVMAVVLFVITMFFQSCTFAGSSVVPLDMAPRLASIITGIYLGAGGFLALFAPITVAYMTPDGTLEQWRSVFYVIIGLYVFGVTVFVLFGSAEVQPWAVGHPAKGTTTSPSDSTVIGTPSNSHTQGHVSHEDNTNGFGPPKDSRDEESYAISTSSVKPNSVVMGVYDAGKGNGQGVVNLAYINDTNDINCVGTGQTETDDVILHDAVVMNTRL